VRRPVRVTATIERHDPRLPRYVVIPRRLLARHGIRDRTTVRGELAGVRFQHRTLHPLDDQRFFINLPERLCAQARVDTGDTVALSFELQTEEIPEELTDALTADAASQEAWAHLSRGEQRRAAWQVAKAAREDTRRRRASRIADELRSSDDG
jgi:hypothetical protein